MDPRTVYVPVCIFVPLIFILTLIWLGVFHLQTVSYLIYSKHRLSSKYFRFCIHIILNALHASSVSKSLSWSKRRSKLRISYELEKLKLCLRLHHRSGKCVSIFCIDETWFLKAIFWRESRKSSKSFFIASCSYAKSTNSGTLWLVCTLHVDTFSAVMHKDFSNLRKTATWVLFLREI